jgi:hypothetical protein
MKNIEIINNINALNVLVEKDMALPVKVGYAINRNLKKLIAEYNIFEEERKKIVPPNYEEKTENEKKEIDVKFNELANIEVDVEIYKINLEDFGVCDSLSARDMLILDFMIED